MSVPMREPIGRNSPSRLYEFGDKLHQKLIDDNEKQKAARERSGKISGGKLGKPTLWAVLDLIGVPDEFDPYVLGKFQRGNDVEDRAIQFLTGIKPWEVEPGTEVETNGETILKGKFILQKSGGYRGGVGYIDLVQVVGDGSQVYHEIKSSTKMAYDKVSASGRSSKGTPAPYLHHALQLSYYCLGDEVTRGFLHYFNADDYRLCTFAINPIDYKEEIDKEIDDIQTVFLTKQLPAFEGFMDWHKLKNYWSYKEFTELGDPQAMMQLLKGKYPEQYKKFMEMEI